MRDRESSEAYTGIDWPALIARQEAANAAISGKRSLSPEAEEAVLKTRAEELAIRPAQAELERRLDCLEFQLSGESYAVEMSYISETLPLSDFTPLFCTPPFVLGITNLRGRIISIIDLRRFFELATVGLSDLNRVIVVGNGSMEFGVLADAIVGMRSLPIGELQPAPATFTGIREEFLAGVTAERLALLDIGKILADKRIMVHEEVS
ncbi:MAG: chemotaxis protein [Geobacteraceae bacterium GWC2_58_44]|nr:MAG: chemotaxis protein [Geobacteraceae bacterium GWC2_58_44]HBG04429.1 chemotaxis protein CheW [Geobacter sp.]